MAYKNVQHYRHTVHRYLDAIWTMSSHKRNARSTMYKLLSVKMNLDIDDTHVAQFTREQCKQAIRILKPMYVQLFGKDLEWKKEVKMYYAERTFKMAVDNKIGESTHTTLLEITVYCKSRKLDNGSVINLELMELGLRNAFNNKYIEDVIDARPTLENIAKYIYEQVIPCYKVKISDEDGDTAIFEEDEE